MEDKRISFVGDWVDSEPLETYARQFAAAGVRMSIATDVDEVFDTGHLVLLGPHRLIIVRELPEAEHITNSRAAGIEPDVPPGARYYEVRGD